MIKKFSKNPWVVGIGTTFIAGVALYVFGIADQGKLIDVTNSPGSINTIDQKGDNYIFETPKRSLSSGDIGNLKNFSGTEYTIQAKAGDTEAERFGMEIMNVLDSSGWKMKDSKLVFGSEFQSGVSIEVIKRNSISDALLSFFLNQGFKAQGFENASSSELTIYVGPIK